VTDVRAQALSCLRDGRVQIVHARCIKVAGGPPDEVIAKVASARPDSNRVYVVDHMDGLWTCTCRLLEGCAHIAAVQLVTGHRSAAARDAAA
jgi:hypothetical protein